MKALLLLAAAAAIAWFVYSKFSESSAQATRPELQQTTRSPAEQLAEITSLGMVDAERLSRLCATAPDLALRTLRNRQLTVSGKVHRIHVTGLSGRRVEIVLTNRASHPVVAVCDLDRGANTTRIGTTSNRNLQFAVMGNELVLVDKATKHIQRLLLEGQSFSKPLTLENISPTSVSLAVDFLTSIKGMR